MYLIIATNIKCYQALEWLVSFFGTIGVSVKCNVHTIYAKIIDFIFACFVIFMCYYYAFTTNTKKNYQLVSLAEYLC